jgi:hypothetical protein
LEGGGGGGGVEDEGVGGAVAKDDRVGVRWRDFSRKRDVRGTSGSDWTGKGEYCTIIRWEIGCDVLEGSVCEFGCNHEIFLLNLVLSDNCNGVFFPSHSTKYNVSNKIRNENRISKRRVLKTSVSEDVGEVQWNVCFRSAKNGASEGFGDCKLRVSTNNKDGVGVLDKGGGGSCVAFGGRGDS